MPNYKAFTLKADVRLNVLKTSCGVSEAYDPKSEEDQPKANRYEAIWDTGATSTVITAKIAKDLDLKPIGFATSHHAGGVTEKVPTYLINVYLLNNVNIMGVKVIEAVLPGNTEILIGMDIISHGDFSFTNVDGKSCFTFRIPSIKQIDYVEESNKSKPKWLKTSKGYKGGRKKR